MCAWFCMGIMASKAEGTPRQIINIPYIQNCITGMKDYNRFQGGKGIIIWIKGSPIPGPPSIPEKAYLTLTITVAVIGGLYGT